MHHCSGHGLSFTVVNCWALTASMVENCAQKCAMGGAVWSFCFAWGSYLSFPHDINISTTTNNVEECRLSRFLASLIGRT